MTWLLLLVVVVALILVVLRIAGVAVLVWVGYRRAGEKAQFVLEVLPHVLKVLPHNIITSCGLGALVLLAGGAWWTTGAGIEALTSLLPSQ